MEIKLDTSNICQIKLATGEIFELYDSTSGELEITAKTRETMEVLEITGFNHKPLGKFRHIRVSQL